MSSVVKSHYKSLSLDGYKIGDFSIFWAKIFDIFALADSKEKLTLNVELGDIGFC